MKTRWIALSLLAASLTPSLAQAQNHTGQGAALGGLAGALGGAAIGKHNGETAAGALIGGAVGLVTGAAIGSAKDQAVARDHAYRQYAYQQQMAQVSRAASSSDVVAMVHSGVSDVVIINHIQQHGVQRRPEVADVIALSQQGVSEAVITAMQRAPLAGAVIVPAPATPQTVIVQEHHYVAPRYYGPPRYHHHHHHYHRPGYSMGISVGR